MNQRPKLMAFLALSVFIGLRSGVAQQNNFEFHLKNAKDPSAERYIVERLNVKVFVEDFKPGNSYWGIIENEKPGKLTFRFPLSGPLKRCKLLANIHAANFQNSRTLGKGIGSVSLWASRDGQEWILLDEMLAPQKTSFDGKYFSNYLPRELQGTKEVWIQVRFTATGMIDTSYSVAQFCRDIVNDPNGRVFSLSAFCQEPKNRTNVAKSAETK